MKPRGPIAAGCKRRLSYQAVNAASTHDGALMFSPSKEHAERRHAVCAGISLLIKIAKKTSVRAAKGLDVRAQSSATATQETVRVRFSTHYQVRSLLRCLAKGWCIGRAVV